MNNNKQFKILFWNVKSIQNKTQELLILPKKKNKDKFNPDWKIQNKPQHQIKIKKLPHILTDPLPIPATTTKVALQFVPRSIVHIKVILDTTISSNFILILTGPLNQNFFYLQYILLEITDFPISSSPPKNNGHIN